VADRGRDFDSHCLVVVFCSRALECFGGLRVVVVREFFYFILLYYLFYFFGVVVVREFSRGLVKQQIAVARVYCVQEVPFKTLAGAAGAAGHTIVMYKIDVLVSRGFRSWCCPLAPPNPKGPQYIA
jgi:hypothetical protein